MKSNKPVTTLQRKSLTLFSLSTLFVFTLSLIFIAKILCTRAENNIIEQTHQWAKILATDSYDYVDTQDALGLKNKLVTLNNIHYIQQVNIYTQEEQTNKLHLFTFYKRELRTTISNSSELVQLNNEAKVNLDTSEVSQLLSENKTDTTITLSYPIQSAQTIIGYVYIKSSFETAIKNTEQFIMLLGVFAVLVFLILLFIVNHIINLAITPLDIIAQEVKEIAQNKDFSKRCSESKYYEINWLIQKINILLSRVEKHVIKLTEAEQKYSYLNTELESKIERRTSALKESNQELLSTLEKLHQYQNQLVESEKMASLGDMVAGVAHEVNTPIGLGVTASTLLADNLASIKTAFEDKTLKSSQLKKFLNDSTENIDIIYRNLTRSADLISSFKKVAVDQSTQESRKFNVQQLIKDVRLTLEPQFRNTNYQFIVHCPNNLEIKSKPGPLNQILVNLIVNSLIHGFDKREHGKITINVMLLNEQIQITYEDDGIGVDDSIHDKIFEPFITTKRGSGGSGLGLHLVYNLVTQALLGTITFDSAKNKGVKFNIIFPFEQ
jgi:signal transduction histidine kinase